MDDQAARLDHLARTFVDAATALGEALVAKLGEQDPELAAKVAHGLEHGERLMLGLEFSGPSAAVHLVTIDDYQNVKRVMHIPGKAPARH